MKIVGLSSYFHVMEEFMSVGVEVFMPKQIKLVIIGLMIQEVVDRTSLACHEWSSAIWPALLE